MAKYIDVFEACLQHVEWSFPGYLTILDCLKIFNFHFPDFKYAHAAKFTLDSGISQIITAKLRSVPDLELLLQTVIKSLFSSDCEISAHLVSQIEARMQLIIILTLIIKSVNKIGILSRRFISSSLHTFKATARLYEVILSCFYLADEGFLLAYNHFSTVDGDEAAGSDEKQMLGLLGFFFWLCFESFTPTVAEFLHINLGRIEAILSARPKLSFEFYPFLSLLRLILAANCRADQVALDSFRLFAVSSCEEHDLTSYLRSFMNIEAPLTCRELGALIIKKFGNPELLELCPSEFASSNTINYASLSIFLESEIGNLETEDLNYILEAAHIQDSEEYKTMLRMVHKADPEALKSMSTKMLKLLEQEPIEVSPE